MIPDQRLEARVAVVTGAGRGIGRAHALAMAGAGAAVAVNDIDYEAAIAVADEIRSFGGIAIANQSDIAVEGGGVRLIRLAEDALGSVDILVTNAGAVRAGPNSWPSRGIVDSMIDVHLHGTLEPIGAVLPGMMDRGWGRIVTTVSEVALAPWSGSSEIAYGAAKAAVWSGTLSLANMVSGSGVTVNAISPGARTRISADAIDGNPRSSELDLDPAHVAAAVLELIAGDFGDVNGAVFHVAGTNVREYLPVRRVSDSELVARLKRALDSADATIR